MYRTKKKPESSRSYPKRIEYVIAKDDVITIMLGKVAYASYKVEILRPKARDSALVFLAFVKGRDQRKELKEGVMEMELTVKQIYNNLWGFSPYFKELHQYVEKVSAVATHVFVCCFVVSHRADLPGGFRTMRGRGQIPLFF